MKTKTKAIVLAALLVCLLGMSSWTAQRAYRAGWVPPGFATPESFLRDFHLEDPYYPYAPDILVPLRAAPWEDMEEKQADLDHRAQILCGNDAVWIGGEVMQLLFMRIFPQAKMYVVMHTMRYGDRRGTKLPGKLMVTFKDIDYLMPDDFLTLLLDADYTYQDVESLDMRQAVVIVALDPWEVLTEVMCDEGERIYEVFGVGSIPYIYKMNCELAHKGQKLVVKFGEFDPQRDRFVSLSINRRPGKEEENNKGPQGQEP